jgi:hypothetical protein
MYVERMLLKVVQAGPTRRDAAVRALTAALDLTGRGKYDRPEWVTK